MNDSWLHCASLWLALLPLARVQAPGAGESAGESDPGQPSARVVELGPAAQPAVERVGKRLLDAVTGEPVAGAVVEVWAEEYRVPGMLLDSTQSDESGRFEVLARFHDSYKVRVRAEGYASTTWHGLESRDYMLLHPAGPPWRLRVLDLDWRSVQGATALSHQSCYHDPPAISGRSDALGYITLFAPPARVDHGELMVLAPGHSAIAALDPDDLTFGDQAFGGGDVFVPRRRPLRLQLLEADGRPLAQRRVVLGSSPEWQAGWTDERGLISFDSLFLDRYAQLEVGDEREPRYFAGFYAPASWSQRWIPVRDQLPTPDWRDSDWREESERALASLTITVDAGQREALTDPRIQVFHEDGWMASGAREHELPPGRVWVVVGAEFSGIEERVHELKLAAGLQQDLVVGVGSEADIPLESETRLLVRVPAQPTAWTLHVQAGEAGHSDELRPNQVEHELCVPSGRPLTLLAEARGELRRLRIPEPREGQVVDLATQVALVRRSSQLAWEAGELSRARLLVRLRDAHGEPFDLDAAGRAPGGWQASGWELFGAVEIEDDLDPASDVVLVELPAGMRYELQFTARGCRPQWIGGRAPEPAGASGTIPTAELDVTFERLASLEVRGPGLDGEPERGIAPGKVRRILTRSDGSRVLVEVQLAEGEQRVVSLEGATGNAPGDDTGDAPGAVGGPAERELR